MFKYYKVVFLSLTSIIIIVHNVQGGTYLENLKLIEGQIHSKGNSHGIVYSQGNGGYNCGQEVWNTSTEDFFKYTGEPYDNYFYTLEQLSSSKASFTYSNTTYPDYCFNHGWDDPLVAGPKTRTEDLRIIVNSYKDAFSDSRGNSESDSMIKSTYTFLVDCTNPNMKIRYIKIPFTNNELSFHNYKNDSTLSLYSNLTMNGVAATFDGSTLTWILPPANCGSTFTLTPVYNDTYDYSNAIYTSGSSGITYVYSDYSVGGIFSSISAVPCPSIENFAYSVIGALDQSSGVIMPFYASVGEMHWTLNVGGRTFQGTGNVDAKWDVTNVPVGAYTAKLSAQTSDGICSDSKDLQVNVVKTCHKSISYLSSSGTTINPSSGGTITFYGTIPDTCGSISSWTLNISDKTFTGTGTTVSEIWNGKDASGKILPSGQYTATFSVQYSDGSTDTKSLTITVIAPLKINPCLNVGS